MNIRDLKYLISIAKHKHFGKAAKECFVSQPALSIQIKKLEEEFAMQFFERNNKNVLITPAGKQFIEKAKQIVSIAEEMKDLSNIFSDPFAGEIKIGAFPTLAPYFFPLILPKINKAFPNLELLLYEEKTNDLINKLLAGELDAAFLALPLPVDETQLEIVNLFEEAFYFAVSTQNPLSHKKAVTQKDIINEKFLLLEEGHCLRDQALSICKMAGITEYQNFRATSLETLRQMVAQNIGVTLIPKMAINKNIKNIVYIPFNKNQYARKIALTWRKSSARNALYQTMSKTIKELQHAN